ncbi:MAG: hypothetical protein Kow0025_10980 [Thermodesulfovibrionales bacterium]
MAEEPRPKGPGDASFRVEISDEDIFDAMKEVQGFIDITPGDFKEVYRHAYSHALERIARQVKARDIMTRQVVSVAPDAPVEEVAARMAEAGVSGLPVVEGGEVLGVISEKDFLSRMGGARSFMAVVAECLRGKGCVAFSMRARLARDIMSSPAVTVGEGASAAEIAELFTSRGINRVPVVDAQGRLAGIVSRGDVVRVSGNGPGRRGGGA